MPADLIHPEQLDGEARFCADLVAYLDSLTVGELAELLGELPRSRQQPLGLGVLMVALNGGCPTPSSCSRPPATPARTRSAAARCGSWSPTAAPPAPAATLTRQRRAWLRGWPIANSRPTCRPSAPGRASLVSGGWPRRCALGPAIPTGRPAARSPATRRPSGSATGRSRSAAASPRTTSVRVSVMLSSGRDAVEPPTEADQRASGAEDVPDAV
jgi:hypothetical protein